MSHTAESVFQMAFEEIYSSDASTWHLQFHGNADTAAGMRRRGRVPEQRRRGRARHRHVRHALYAQREHRGGLEARGGRRARPHG